MVKHIFTQSAVKIERVSQKVTHTISCTRTTFFGERTWLEDVWIENVYTSSSLKYKVVETDRRHSKTILQVFIALVPKTSSEKLIQLFKKIWMTSRSGNSMKLNVSSESLSFHPETLRMPLSNLSILSWSSQSSSFRPEKKSLKCILETNLSPLFALVIVWSRCLHTFVTASPVNI